MRKLIFLASLFLTSLSVPAQIGIKAGLNFANVSNASSINSSSRSGFHAGVMLAPPSKKILSSRTELIFSKQGYDYKSGSNTGTVNLNYLQFGQMASVNITKYFSLLLGAQTAYLLNAKVDSTNSNGNSTGSNIMNLYNRFDYGYALGAEAHPIKGLLIGVRYNVSLNQLYESVQTGGRPSFTSEDAKNNVVQLYIGWRFGKSSDQKNKEQ
jgi:hypothetical protein